MNMRLCRRSTCKRLRVEHSDNHADERKHGGCDRSVDADGQEIERKNKREEERDDKREDKSGGRIVRRIGERIGEQIGGRTSRRTKK